MNKQDRKTTLLLMLSAAFEYYDFIIYGLMANYIGILFFPSDDLFMGQLKAFSIFAIGYLFRPLGGVIFGMLGDLRGRKKIFIQNNIILSIATIIISILPDYNQIGVTATVILVTLRIIQSLAFAAELPGAMSLIKDMTKEPSTGFGFVVSGAALGSILASLSLYSLESIFDQKEILSYAWRFPFILGAVLCLIGMIMRSKLPEIAYNKKIDIISSILPSYRNVITFSLLIAVPAYLIIMNIFFPSFISKFYHYNSQEVFLAIGLSLTWSIVFSPLFARMSQNASKGGLIRIVIFLSMILGLVINFLWLRGGFLNLLLGLCIYQSIISSLMVLIFPLMAEIFPSSARFTLIAICYNIAYLIVAFAPSLISKLAAYLESPISLWLGLILLSIIALANMASFEENHE